MEGLKSTTIWSKTLSGQPRLGKRTGCFLAMPRPGTAALYSTPSSNAAAVAAWNPTPTCAIF